MVPTNRLRFVEREEEMHPFYKTVDVKGNLVRSVHKYRVLQQWWSHNEDRPELFLMGANGEWRDVPLEQE